MHWDHRFKDIVFCIGLTFGILGSLKCVSWRVLRPSDKGYIDYRCRIYGISLAWKWDSWRVLGPSPQGFMASGERLFSIMTAWNWHSCLLGKSSASLYMTSWETLFSILAAWKCYSLRVERRPAVIGYVRKNVKEWILAARNFDSSRWWIRYLAIIEPLFGILTCKYMISQRIMTLDWRLRGFPWANLKILMSRKRHSYHVKSIYPG